MKNQTIAKIINCLHTAYLVELGKKPISNKQLHYLELLNWLGLGE